MDADDTMARWCNLPKDLLIIIAKRLDTSTEILRLRAVCSSWRSSLPCSLNKSPLFSVKYPKHPGQCTLSERTIYYLEPCSFENPNASASPKGWMVKVEEAESGKMRILDTLSKHKLSGSLNVSPKVLNLLNYRVSEVKKIAHIQFVEIQNVLVKIKKVVMSSVPFWTDDSNGDCAILTIHTGGKLGYFKLGDKKWSVLDFGQGRSPYDDILYHNEKFYAVDTKGRMIVIDSWLNGRVIESPVPCYGIRYGYGGKYKFLVESNGDIYLVDKYLDWDQELEYDKELEDVYLSRRNFDCMIHFKVYKLNEEEQEWVQVTSLGDQAFFIGDDCCFSVSASHFTGFKGNCIYFTDIEFSEENDDHPGYDVGMFDLEDYTSGPLSYFEGDSRIFWPPPTWLKPNASTNLKTIF